MRAVILAGGRGTRIAEESQVRPKPMVEIGGQPMLWHIMKGYAAAGVEDFIVCLGYRGYVIKEWFANYVLHNSDVTVDLRQNVLTHHDSRTEPWRVTLVDTGENTQTGGRIKRIRAFIEDEPFFLTYGDGVADVDIRGLSQFHESHDCLVTMTVVRPAARFGNAKVDDRRVVSFEEKPQAESGLINGGFFVVSPGAIDYIEDDATAWESGPLERLAADRQLAAWEHEGFWQAMDTVRERDLLESMWSSGSPPWKTWD